MIASAYNLSYSGGRGRRIMAPSWHEKKHETGSLKQQTENKTA
jgi:hypothetical protein